MKAFISNTLHSRVSRITVGITETVDALRSRGIGRNAARRMVKQAQEHGRAVELSRRSGDWIELQPRPATITYSFR